MTLAEAGEVGMPAGEIGVLALVIFLALAGLVGVVTLVVKGSRRGPSGE